ncbi:C-type lectin domain family 4 member K-like [Labeo rohita]|uniref:C-type lectin domain family 4 member K-like n=1 Tax=Labeo rohita TaxID=84645 RepID=UPI0021E31834|nr:C-type lectin domain family 4 member K-like [Labeo rohita]
MHKRTTQKMDKAGQMRTDNIYENADAIRGEITMEIEDLNTTRIQPPQQTVSDCVKIRNYRAAVVCLVLLCVLLLTAVIVLCFTFTQEISKNENLTNVRNQLILKNTNLTNERDQLILKNTNLTSERDQLILKNTNLTNERDQLILKSTNLTNERDQLLLKNTNLTNEREQLLLKNTNLTSERDQLILKNTNLTNQRDQLILKSTNLTNDRDQLILRSTNLTNERNQLLPKNTNLTSERDQLILKSTNLTNERNQLKQENNDLQRRLGKVDGWIYHQCSYYYISNETKNWYDNRRYCTERGADLIIINNLEEQEFVRNISGYVDVWIGLTNSNLEGRWKWVDNSTLTSGFWGYGKPYSYYEDCAVSYISWWHAYSCNSALKWICET